MKRHGALILLVLVSLGCPPSRNDRTLRHRYRYDRENRLVESIAPDGSSTRYYYDKQGQPSAVTYAKGRTDFGYNGDELLWTRDKGGSTEYFRDHLGRVTDMLWSRNGIKLVHLDLDPWGGLTGVSVYGLATAHQDLSGPLPRNAKGREKREQAVRRFMEAAGTLAPEYSVRYERDVFGRLTGMDSLAGRVTFAYRDEAREVERRLANGLRTVWRYTADGLIESVVHYEPSGREAASWSYVYDAGGLLTRTTEVIAGRPVETRMQRDSSGMLQQVSATGMPAQTWQHDAYGRPVREGGASLEWNRAGRLESRSANGLRVKFEYDGRDLPIRASSKSADFRFRWDTEGRLDAYTTPQGKYALLPDLAGSGADPWLEWKLDGSGRTSYFSDGAAYAEVDARGNLRYLLRDGQGRVRLSADRDGHVEVAGVPVGTRGIVQPAAFGNGNRPEAAEGPRELAIYAALNTAERQAHTNGPELRGWLFNTKVQNYVADFLKDTTETEVDYDLRGISNDWNDAWRDTKNYYPNKTGLVIPMYGSIPKPTHFVPGTFWEKFASATPFVGRIQQTKKIDLVRIFEQTRAAGKRVNSVSFESGAGFEAQRQVDDLVRYSREHPSDRLPKIILVSTGMSEPDRQRLRDARYQVADIGKDPLVPMIVENGPLARVPLLGRAASIPLQLGQAGWMAGAAAIHGDGVHSLIEGHGARPNRFKLFEEQAKARTDYEAPLRDPAAEYRQQLGGVELGAKASAAGDIETIRGVVYDKDSQQVALVGENRISAEGLDAEDFAVALLLAYNDPPLTPSFSLDPADPKKPDGKWMKAVYMPQELLAGTGMGRTMFITDWLMKQYSFGLSVDSDGKVTQRRDLPGGLLDEFTLTFRNPQFNEKKASWTRMWIVAEDFRIQVHDNTLTFETAKMGVRAKRQVVDPASPTGLRDDEREVDASAREFAAMFTANYDKVAEESPEFHRLRELAKAVALANWLRDSGVPVDLEWARQLAARRSPYVDKVPTLTNGREQVSESKERDGNRLVISRDTRSMHLTGGVSLAVKPLRSAQSAVAKGVSAAAAPMRTQPAFLVETAGARLQGGVLPVTRTGRAAWSRAGSHTLGDARRTLDAAGRPVRLEYRTGKAVEYTYGKEGQLAAAKVSSTAGRAEAYQFGPGGRIVSGELRGQVKMTAHRGADGTLDSLRFRTPSGTRAEAAFGRSAGPAVPPGGSRLTVVRNGRKLHYHYDSRGNLVSVNSSGTHVASYSVEGQTVTARSGAYSESVTLAPDGRLQTIRRTAPDLDGKMVTQTAEVPAASADRAASAVVPEERLKLPSGSTVKVNGATSRGGSTLEISQRPATAETVIGRNAATVDGQGIIRGQRSEVIGRLGTETAPTRMVVMDTPARVGELQLQYGKSTEFYLATERQLAVENMRRLPVLTKAEEVAVYFPARQAKVVDFEAIHCIRGELTGMKAVDGILPEASSKVVVLTGHNSAEWKIWVETLGKSDALRGKVVLMNSCHGALDTAWNSRLIREYGATATHAFAEAISPQAVKDVMMQFHQILRSPRGVGASLQSIWRTAVDEAAKLAPSGWLRQQIETLRKGVTQLSRNKYGHGREDRHG